MTPSGLLHLPANEHKQAVTGYVHLHGPGQLPDLTGCRIIVEKWNSRTFTLQGHEFHVIPEAAVLAVLDPPERLQEAV